MTPKPAKSPCCGSLQILSWCVLAASIAGTLNAILLRDGVRLTPDSWVYWEGGTSLLHGHGYYEFFGRRIWSWPPLYSIYLAGTERVLGCSGRQLALSNVALAVAAAFAWSAAILAPFGPSLAQARGTSRHTFVYPLLAVLFIALTICGSYSYGAALAHNLAYVLFPLVLYMTHRTVQSATPTSNIVLASVNAVLLSLLLCTHNSFVFLPVLAAALIVLLGSQRWMIRLIAGAVSSAVPIAVWFGVRMFLGQLHSHTPGLKPEYSWGEYARQTLAGVGALCGPRRHHVGTALLFAVCAVALLGLLKRRSVPDPARRAVFSYLFMTGGFLGWLYIVFNTTFIFEELYRDRFVLFVPLTLVPAALMLFWHTHIRQIPPTESAAPTAHRLNPAYCLVLALFIAVTVSAALRTAWYYRMGRAGGGPVDPARVSVDMGFAYNCMTIRTDYVEGPPMRIGSLILVAPPYGKVSPQEVRMRHESLAEPR